MPDYTKQVEDAKDIYNQYTEGLLSAEEAIERIADILLTRPAPTPAISDVFNKEQ